MELDGHPWFFGCQFHPEYKSKPILAHPVFVHFVRAALDHRAKKVVPEETSAPKAEAKGEAELAATMLQAQPGGVSPES